MQEQVFEYRSRPSTGAQERSIAARRASIAEIDKRIMEIKSKYGDDPKLVRINLDYRKEVRPLVEERAMLSCQQRAATRAIDITNRAIRESRGRQRL